MPKIFYFCLYFEKMKSFGVTGKVKVFATSFSIILPNEVFGRIYVMFTSYLLHVYVIYLQEQGYRINAPSRGMWSLPQ